MKDLQEDNLFGTLRRRLGGYEESPSEQLWSRIAGAQKKRRGVMWPVLAGVVSVVGIGAFLFLGFENGTMQEHAREVDAVATEKHATHTEQVSKPRLTISNQNKTAQPQSPIPNPQSPILNHQSSINNPQSPIPNQESIISNNQSTPINTPDSVVSLFSNKKTEGVIPPYKKPNSRFQIYLSITPSLSFQKIIPTGDDAIIIQGLANRSPFSLKRFGFAIDVGLQYDLNRILGFYGGLSFYRQQQQLTYNYYNRDAQVTRPGEAWTFEIDRPQQSQTFDYVMTNVGAQTGLLITLKGEKLKHKFGTGIAYSHGILKSTRPYNNSQSAYIAYQLFYRNEIKINETFSWYIEPTFNYTFISKEKLAEPFALKPYRAGISGGVLYRLR